MPPRREPSPPPRRPRSPPPARRDLPLGPDRRPRSPLPARPARERLDQDYRPQPREYASDSERNARRPARRSPSPPPMRKWAVKAVTPPQQEEGAPSAVDDRSENTAAAPSNNKATTNNERASGPDTKVDIETSETAFKTETPSVQQQAEPSSTAEAKAEEKDIVVFPRPREKRVISPGLASRLDQPLSQPPPRDTRRRGGRPSPPPSSRPFRRSPSPDPQRRRLGAPSGSTLADRMGDGPRSLLSRMGDGGDRIEDRPAKRSRQEGRNGSSAMDMDVDSPADLSDRLRGPRPRSQSPPPSGRGISIFGASKTQSNADGEGDVSRSLHVERVKLHDNGNGTSPLLRIADAEPDSSSRYRDRAQVSQERSPDPSRADQAVPAESTQKSISTAQSNGLPPRPTGFASLPPKPSVIVPPPDMRGPPRREPSSSNTVLLDSYRPGQPDRRPSSRGPPVSKEPPELDRYVPRRLPPSGRGPRVGP